MNWNVFDRALSHVADAVHDVPDFNLLSLSRGTSNFRPGGLSNFEPPSLDFEDFGNIFEDSPLRLSGMNERILGSLDRINLPNPRDVIDLGFSERDSSSLLFGDTLNFFSKLHSGPDVLQKFGLHGGPEEIGGILGRLNPSNWFGGGGADRGLSGLFGGAEGGLSGILGGVGHSMPILKGALSLMKGDWWGAAGSGIAALFSGLPVVGPFIGIASLLGVDKLLGTAAKGIGNAVKSIGKGIAGAVGGFFKKLF